MTVLVGEDGKSVVLFDALDRNARLPVTQEEEKAAGNPELCSGVTRTDKKTGETVSA